MSPARAKAKLQAFYTLAELGDMAGGFSRWKILRLLRSNGVEIDTSSRPWVVYLSALKRGIPDLWDSIRDRESVAEYELDD